MVQFESTVRSVLFDLDVRSMDWMDWFESTVRSLLFDLLVFFFLLIFFFTLLS